MTKKIHKKYEDYLLQLIFFLYLVFSRDPYIFDPLWVAKVLSRDPYKFDPLPWVANVFPRDPYLFDPLWVAKVLSV